MVLNAQTILKHAKYIPVMQHSNVHLVIHFAALEVLFGAGTADGTEMTLASPLSPVLEATAAGAVVLFFDRIRFYMKQCNRYNRINMLSNNFFLIT